MKTKHTQILKQNGDYISGSKVLLWGNNAAWLCKCGELVGARTSSSEKDKPVECTCGLLYLLVAKPNKKGLFNKGSAESVVLT